MVKNIKKDILIDNFENSKRYNNMTKNSKINFIFSLKKNKKWY